MSATKKSQVLAKVIKLSLGTVPDEGRPSTDCDEWRAQGVRAILLSYMLPRVRGPRLPSS